MCVSVCLVCERCLSLLMCSGFAGGLQCDIWPHAASVPLGASDALPPPLGPTLKLRLPKCSNSEAVAVESGEVGEKGQEASTNTTSCTSPLSFTLQVRSPHYSVYQTLHSCCFAF